MTHSTHSINSGQAGSGQTWQSRALGNTRAVDVCHVHREACIHPRSLRREAVSNVSAGLVSSFSRGEKVRLRGNAAGGKVDAVDGLFPGEQHSPSPQPSPRGEGVMRQPPGVGKSGVGDWGRL